MFYMVLNGELNCLILLANIGLCYRLLFRLVVLLWKLAQVLP